MDEALEEWLSATAMCFNCGHIWVAVFPFETDDSKLECTKCGKQDSIVVGKR